MQKDSVATASPMILIGVGIIAAGVLALTAFLVFFVRGGGESAGTGAAEKSGSTAVPGAALDRQRAIGERLRAGQAAAAELGAKDESKSAGPPDAAAKDPDKPAIPPEAQSQGGRTPAQDSAAARPLDAVDTASITGFAGKTATVAGRVVSCSWSSTGKVLFINFSGDRKSFYAVMFKNRERDFEESFGSPPEKRLAGSDIEITGEVEMYEGRPQIKLEKPEQVRFRD